MLTAACVLRTGGDFDARWVWALKAGLLEHLPLPHAFVCLSDDPTAPNRIPLEHDWAGWWAKLEALALPESYGHVLLMDLDTLPVGDLSSIAGYRGEFALITNVNGRRKDLQSAVMAFRAGGHARTLFKAFRKRADHWMQKYRGDGEWLNDHAKDPDVLQDLYPDQIASAKWDIGYGGKGPGGRVRLALGHGRPRFTSPKAGWAHRLFQERAA